MTQELKYRITQRKLDTSEDESVYTTAIRIKSNDCLIMGFGITQAEADTAAIENLLKELKGK